MTSGPVEQLLEINEEIMRLEFRARSLKLRHKYMRLSFAAIVLIGYALYVINTSFKLGQHKALINSAFGVPIFLACAVLVITVAFAINDADKQPPRPGIREVELKLSVLYEKRKLKAANLSLPISDRKEIYRHNTASEIDKYRKEGARYRRVHNWLQSVIIVGSLGTATLSSLSVDIKDPFTWATVATSFAVGISAGFTGYFKFRERSYYLQTTADAVERELTAVEFGIGRYKQFGEDASLAEFIEEVERLKAEQRQREQSLEQPSEAKSEK